MSFFSPRFRSFGVLRVPEVRLAYGLRLWASGV